MRYFAWVLILMVGMVGAVFAQRADQPAQRPAAAQYEFRVLFPHEAGGDDDQLEAILNQHGKEGWQVVGTSALDGNPPRLTVILQRPK